MKTNDTNNHHGKPAAKGKARLACPMPNIHELAVKISCIVMPKSFRKDEWDEYREEIKALLIEETTPSESDVAKMRETVAKAMYLAGSVINVSKWRAWETAPTLARDFHLKSATAVLTSLNLLAPQPKARAKKKEGK